MTVDKQPIAAKIKALLSKTSSAGATEAEELAAMSKAIELMEKYNISRSAVEMEAEGFETFDVLKSGDTQFVSKRLSSVISELTYTFAWTGSRRVGLYDQHYTRFHGATSDVIFAQWLIETLAKTVTRLGRLFVSELAKQEPKMRIRDRNILRRSFLHGICDGIEQRMLEEISAREVKQAPGTGLVLADRVMVARTNAIATLGLRLQPMRNRSHSYNAAASRAGASAGDHINWSKPINQSSQLRLS